MKLLLALLAPLTIAATDVKLPTAECGKTFGCFALPNAKCLSDGSCQALVQYKRTSANESHVDINVFRQSDPKDGQYVAFGISQTQNMLTTAALECINDKGNATTRMGFIFDEYKAPVLRNFSAVSVLSAKSADSILQCSYRIAVVMKAGGKTFILNKKDVYALLAIGVLDGNGNIKQHGHKAVSGAKINFSVGKNAVVKSKLFLRLHGECAKVMYS